jgi:hypothetical protein
MRIITKRAAPSLTCVAVAVLTAGSLLAGPLGAQEPRQLAQPDSIPLELALGLSATGGVGAEPQILVGTLPGWVMNKVSLPPGARVIGSAFIGNTVVGIVDVDASPAAAATAARTALMSQGWKAPPPPISTGGGFRNAPASSLAGNSARMTLCEDPEMLTVSAMPQRGSATVLTYRMTTTIGYSTCHLPEPSSVSQRFALPTLINPPQQLSGPVVTACFSGRQGGSSLSTLLNTPLGLDSLLDYYGKQLDDSGWKPEGEKGALVGRTWMRTDSTGAVQEMSLVIHATPQGTSCREASMQYRILSKP